MVSLSNHAVSAISAASVGGFTRSDAPAVMTGHLKDFLKFLELNRNASAHTVRAYDSDLTQFLGHAAARAGLEARELEPAHLGRAALRSFLGELHKQGLTRASAARKLAAVRTFLRYLR